jgi:hypothetical protein
MLCYVAGEKKIEAFQKNGWSDLGVADNCTTELARNCLSRDMQCDYNSLEEMKRKKAPADLTLRQIQRCRNIAATHAAKGLIYHGTPSKDAMTRRQPARCSGLRRGYVQDSKCVVASPQIYVLVVP